MWWIQWNQHRYPNLMDFDFNYSNLREVGFFIGANIFDFQKKLDMVELMMLKLIYEFYEKFYDIFFRYNIPMHMIIYHHGEVNRIIYDEFFN
jgi:hypothetical protein